ncbi:MAG: helix-turn-helix transcriptional regulator [Lachnospiraceae bacterium]|nr:helix-turn-helix transcriptional regulator [Lachnospiraceae bacterium]
MKDNYKKIGKKISSRRNELGFTQEELAELIGVEPNTIYCYERGDYLSNYERGARLEKALEISLKDLFMI